MRVSRTLQLFAAAALFGLVLFFAADGGSPHPAEAAIGSNSCLDGGCSGATASIGDNSCNGLDACLNATGVIGNNACIGDASCKNFGGATGTNSVGNGSCDNDAACRSAGSTNGPVVIGTNSCDGQYACWDAAGNIGDDACGEGEAACQGNTGTIGNNSCNGFEACKGNTGTIAAGSCNGYQACQNNTSSIGAGSCNSYRTCAENTGTIGAGSCTGDAGACDGNKGSVGDGSCIGYETCYQAGGAGGSSTIGNGSCTTNYSCRTAGFGGVSVIGDGSCMDAPGGFACAEVGTSGNSVIGDRSCSNAYSACGGAGKGGSSVIGNDSCNGAVACLDSGVNGATSTIGNGSCNGDDQCMGNTGTIGNCQENIVEVLACQISPVTVKPVAQTVAYGAAAPKYTFTASGEEGPFDAWLTEPVCTSAYTPTTSVGASPVAITCTGGDADGRPIVHQDGKITITPVVLTIIPDAQTWALGTPEPPYTFSARGFKNSETLSTIRNLVPPVCGPRKGTPTQAGAYTIVCQGGSASDYTFEFESNVLTVTGTLPQPTPTPSPTPVPKAPAWQQPVAAVSAASGYPYAGDCAGVTAASAGKTCSTTTVIAAQGVEAGQNRMIIRLYLVLQGGALSQGSITLEFRGSGDSWLLVSQTGSLTDAPTTPVRAAPAPPNTGTGQGGGRAGWLLFFGALAMAAGGAAVWGKSRR